MVGVLALAAAARGGAISDRKAAATTTPLPLGGAPGPWYLKFRDEFNGTSVNSTKWNQGWVDVSRGVSPPISGLQDECFNSSQLAEAGGSLRLNAAKVASNCGAHKAYTSGLVDTDQKFNFTYGFMEARINLAGNGANVTDWPAFWADGQNWPQTGEIDVVEGLGGQTSCHFHYSGGEPDGGCPNVGSGWHTFGADWEAKAITFYYDGSAVGAIRHGVTGARMYVILNLALSAQISPPDVAPARMQVDYVRIWQHS